MTSLRDILVPRYHAGLAAVATLLSKAAPLDDLYLYLRDHPLQNPAKAKVHCEHGFYELRSVVKIYLEVSFRSLSSSNIYVDPILKKCKHLCPKVLRRSSYLIMRDPAEPTNLFTQGRQVVLSFLLIWISSLPSTIQIFTGGGPSQATDLVIITL